MEVHIAMAILKPVNPITSFKYLLFLKRKELTVRKSPDKEISDQVSVSQPKILFSNMEREVMKQTSVHRLFFHGKKKEDPEIQ